MLMQQQQMLMSMKGGNSFKGPVAGCGGPTAGFGGKAGGKGQKGCQGGSQGGVGEVRYESPMHAQLAAMQLNGSQLNGAQISLGFDQTSQDSTKLWVTGIPPGTAWQELKDHFGSVGKVAYANVKG